MKTNIYIKSVAAISPLQEITEDKLIVHIENRKGNKAKCIEPNYKEYIPPIKARRMSRVLKMTLVAAKECLKKAKIQTPEMISVATGMGCQTDTIKFLEQLITDKEAFLKPTAFINSTHNTLAGYLALDLNSKGQNFSFTHNDLNFEHALLDSVIRLENKEVNNVLLGAVDEISEKTHIIKDKMNILFPDNQQSNKVFNTDNSGIIEGEGAVFTVLEKENNSDCHSKITALDFAYGVEDYTDFDIRITDIAHKNNFQISEIDGFIIGSTGNNSDDAPVEDWITEKNLESKTMRYKHISGEYMVSGGIGLWIAANIIYQKTTPKYLFSSNIPANTLDKILLINHNGNNNFSFILIQGND